MYCPSFDKLILCVSGKLDDQEREEITNHISLPCLPCQEKLTWYKEVVSWHNAIPSDSGDPLCEQTKWLLEESGEAEGNSLIITFATPIYDSIGLNSRPGVRKGGPALDNSRRLLYQANLFNCDVTETVPNAADLRNRCDIDMVVKHSQPSDRYAIRAQVLFKQESDSQFYTPVVANLYRQGKYTATVRIDRHGEFAFADLPPGHYNIQIKGEKAIILISLSLFPVK